MFRPVIAAAGLAAVLSLSAPRPAPAADPDPDAVKKARVLVEAEQKRIWRLAHITVKKFTKLEPGDAVATTTGFKVPYTVTWSVKEKGKEVEHTTKFAVHFNAKGTLAGVPVGDVIEVGADTSKSKPFEGADLVVAFLREYVKKNIALVPDPLRTEIEKEIKEKLTAVRFLALWLKFREHVAPPEDKDDK